MPLIGSVSPPGDKSISHRLALMSLLAEGECQMENLSTGADVASSLAAVSTLTFGFLPPAELSHIRCARGDLVSRAEIDCGNSGTTIRLLMGILAGRPGEFTLNGDESLQKRPMERVAAPLRMMGAEVVCANGCCPVTIKGGSLKGIEYRLPVASAQLKSAVLLAGLQAEGRTTVEEPGPSRDHTERLFESMGGRIVREANRIHVEKSGLVYPLNVFVPGDPSSAAFFLCAAAIIPGSRVTAEKVLLNPTRIGFVEVLRRMGARVRVEEQDRVPEPWGNITVEYSPDLTGTTVRPEEIPTLVDEVPILALVAVRAGGRTVFMDVGELRLKESDRLAAVSGQLGKMGAGVTVEDDRLIVDGPADLKAPDSRLESFKDHRIAMTLRLASLLTGGRVEIAGEESLAISYPGFGQDLKRLWS